MSYLDTAQSLANLGTSLAEARQSLKDADDSDQTKTQAEEDKWATHTELAAAVELGAGALRKGVDYAKSLKAGPEGGGEAGAGEAGAGEAGAGEAGAGEAGAAGAGEAAVAVSRETATMFPAAIPPPPPF